MEENKAKLGLSGDEPLHDQNVGSADLGAYQQICQRYTDRPADPLRMMQK